MASDAGASTSHIISLSVAVCLIVPSKVSYLCMCFGRATSEFSIEFMQTVLKFVKMYIKYIMLILLWWTVPYVVRCAFVSGRYAECLSDTLSDNLGSLYIVGLTM